MEEELLFFIDELIEESIDKSDEIDETEFIDYEEIIEDANCEQELTGD